MEFYLKCCYKGDPSSAWEERYDEDTDDAEKWSRETIDFYNRTLRPGETPRDFLSVRVVGYGAHKHDWQKTNSVTILRGGSIYDTYKCGRCGITGKRFSLSEFVVRDAKFKALKYEVCTPKEMKHESN